MGYNEPILVKIVNAALSIVQILISLYIILKLFGASPVPFVKWVYHLNAPLLKPFNGIFKSIHYNGHYVLDLSAVFALIVYSIFGYFLVKLAIVISGSRKK